MTEKTTCTNELISGIATFFKNCCQAALTDIKSVTIALKAGEKVKLNYSDLR